MFLCEIRIYTRLIEDVKSRVGAIQFIPPHGRPLGQHLRLDNHFQRTVITIIEDDMRLSLFQGEIMLIISNSSTLSSTLMVILAYVCVEDPRFRA